MYQWIVYLHVLISFLFMLAHGVHVSAMLSFRAEKDPARALTFFNIVPAPTLIRWLTALLSIAGLTAAFMSTWWKQGWVWASVGVFLVITVVMGYYGPRYYSGIEAAANGLIEARKSNAGVATAEQEYERWRLSAQPMIVSIVGILGLAVILWLMRFKPF